MKSNQTRTDLKKMKSNRTELKLKKFGSIRSLYHTDTEAVHSLFLGTPEVTPQ